MPVAMPAEGDPPVAVSLRRRALSAVVRVIGVRRPRTRTHIPIACPWTSQLLLHRRPARRIHLRSVPVRELVDLPAPATEMWELLAHIMPAFAVPHTCPTPQAMRIRVPALGNPVVHPPCQQCHRVCSHLQRALLPPVHHRPWCLPLPHFWQRPEQPPPPPLKWPAVVPAALAVREEVPMHQDRRVRSLPAASKSPRTLPPNWQQRPLPIVTAGVELTRIKARTAMLAATAVRRAKQQRRLRPS